VALESSGFDDDQHPKRMARGARVTPGPVALPKAQFERIKDDVSTQPNGVHDGQARSYGCKCCTVRGCKVGLMNTPDCRQ